MTTRPTVMLMALALSACSGEEAERTRAPDAEGTRTLVQPAPYVPAKAGLCQGAPADLAGMMVWVDARGLWRTPRANEGGDRPILVEAWEPGEVPRSPVTRVADGGLPSLFVATRTPAGCRLRMYDSSARVLPVRMSDAVDCTSPGIRGGHIGWPLADDLGAGHRIMWFGSISDPAVVTPLDERPTTPPVSISAGEAYGGGSHWLVGSERGIVVIEESFERRDVTDLPIPVAPTAPAVVARYEERDGVITSLVPAFDPASGASSRGTATRLVIATVRPFDEDEGLGERFRILELTTGEEVALIPRGDIIDAPGPMLAHPLTIDRCSRAGGGSHWYCGGDDVGAFVAGGEGWIAAWGLPSGEPRFSRDDDLAWTGLAIGSGGWISGGGSHWRPGEADDGWAVRIVHPGPTGSAIDAVELELARGPETGACIPSPLWDTDGDLSVPVLGTTTTIARVELAGLVRGLALGRGQTRPLGGNANTGYSISEPGGCVDGIVRDLHVERLPDAEIAGVAAASDVFFVYGARAGAGFVRRIVAHGDARDLVLGSTPFVEHVVPHVAAGGVVQALVSTHERVDDRPVQRFALFDERGDRLWDRTLELDMEGAFIGVAPLSDERWVVGTRAGSRDRLRVLSATGLSDLVGFDEAETPVGLERLLVDRSDWSERRDGVVMILTGNDGALHVRRLDHELQAIGLATYAVPDRIVAVIDATIDGAGEVRILVDRVIPSGGGEARWLRFDRDLELVADRPAPYIGSMATLYDGSTLINGGHGLVRVGPDDQVGNPHPLGPDLLPLDRKASWPRPEDGFVIGQRRFGMDGQELWLARTDRLGFASCGAAGLCLGPASAWACDTAGPCERSGCDPDTGRCTSGPIPICEP